MSKERLIDGYTRYRWAGGRHTRKDFSVFRWQLRMTPDEILAEEITTYGKCGPHPSLWCRLKKWLRKKEIEQ